MTLAMTPPDLSTFHRRGDPNDLRLGETVSLGGPADVAILGAPQDMGVQRNGGRPGAAAGPAAIRRAFYMLTMNGLDGLRMADLGDTPVLATLEETHAAQRALVARALQAHALVIVLGGGNDISWPDAGALHDVSPPIAAVNIDAHFDVRIAQAANSGTPYRQLIASGALDVRRFAEFGWLPHCNSHTYERFLRDSGATLVNQPDASASGIAPALRQTLSMIGADASAALFWGVDLDVLNASEAPGVSAPNPYGFTGRELGVAMAIAGAHPRTRLVEISELNPSADTDGRTARLAAALIHTLLRSWLAMRRADAE